MTKTQIIVLVVAVLSVLSLIVFPIVNKRQFSKLPVEQQIRILMKQAKKLIYWKNIGQGTKGSLVYIKNKRKILVYPWVLVDGKMLCTKANPYDRWDYPEDKPEFTEDEIKQALEELEKYNRHNPVKLYLQDNE
ncbi:MAG: hypothetical protein ACI4IG_06535 [Eubacterium sp.]